MNQYKRLLYTLAMISASTMSGCASYYSHFASFDANNSAGEPRKFVVSWQSADYPDWFWSDDTSTPITLKTQCSERVLKFYDNSISQKQSCVTNNSGIVTCGDRDLDLASNGKPVASNESVCGSIVGVNNANKIAKLGTGIRIKIDCFPASTEYKLDGKPKNTDYLKFSVAPYTIQTKKVPLHSLADRVPEMSDKICKKK